MKSSTWSWNIIPWPKILGESDDQKGDPTKPDNYHSTCILPMPNTWFFTMLQHGAHLTRLGWKALSRRRIILWRADVLPKKKKDWELTCGRRFRRLSIQYNMMQFGVLSVIILSMSSTFVCWQRCRLTNAPPCWRRWRLMNTRLLVEQKYRDFSSSFFSCGSQISNGEGHWHFEWKGLGHQTASNLRFVDDVIMMTTSLKSSKEWSWTSKKQKSTRTRNPDHENQTGHRNPHVELCAPTQVTSLTLLPPPTSVDCN